MAQGSGPPRGGWASNQPPAGGFAANPFSLENEQDSMGPPLAFTTGITPGGTALPPSWPPPAAGQLPGPTAITTASDTSAGLPVSQQRLQPSPQLLGDLISVDTPPSQRAAVAAAAGPFAGEFYGLSAPPPASLPSPGGLTRLPQSFLSRHGSMALTHAGSTAVEDAMEHPLDTQVPAVYEDDFKGTRVQGVHGAEMPTEGEATQGLRVIQVQTLGGEGVLSAWRRFKVKIGLRKKRRPGQGYVSNELTTSKYSIVTFLPINLFEQFKRVANLYFLLLIGLQAIPGLSPVPWYATFFPLALVLIMNAIKEAFDDYFRHKSDEEVNHRRVTLLREEGDQTVLWKNLQVGDLIKLHNNEDIPADLVLLSTSDPDNLCYVETANLDGETNLKVKFCHTATADLDSAEAYSKAGYFTVECEAPNPRLYAFEGAICHWDSPPILSQPTPWPNNAQNGTTSSTRATAAAAPGSALPGGAAVQQRQQQQQLQRSKLARDADRGNRGGRKGGGTGSFRAGPGNSGTNSGVGFAGDDALQAPFRDGRQSVSRGPSPEPVGRLSRDPLDVQNLLLRGSTLRKTEWVTGVVVFTGADTKIVRNMLPAPRKITQLERHMNYVVMAMFAFLGTLALVLSLAHIIWELLHSPSSVWYLQRQDVYPELAPGIGDFVVTAVRFIILTAQAIPISLYVTLELVKVIQCKVFFDLDREMYWAKEDVPFNSRTTTLNEELGQVQYVLSDKTGTLTQNVMGFVWASVGGKLYGRSITHGTPASQQPLNPEPSSRALPKDVPPDTPHCIALDSEFRGDLASSQGEAARQFLLGLALCNTVVPTATEEGQLLYQAASPDEEALVAGAAYLGTKLLSRTGTAAEVEALALVVGRDGHQIPDRSLSTYSILAVLEFSSDRKRMSVVTRDAQGTLMLWCKGADNVVLERLAQGQPLLNNVMRDLQEMANTGYRTLVVAAKELQPEAFHRWAADYKAALSALDGREARVAACCEEMECELTLLGATAVEDKLQDGVPEAIATLKAAGVKVWVLTGDKMETAITIAHTARLFTSSMGLLRLTEADLKVPGVSPGQVLEGMRQSLHTEGVANAGASTAGAGTYSTGLVIDGAALALVLVPEAEMAFLQLCAECSAVVCCRVSPMQKAQVTRLVKKRANAITLAIGDGANDVSMIQAAHIGVGISGREGRAAVQAADYAFGQFRFLARLLLVHGRQSYLRNREVVLYAFYKNLSYISCYVFFACYSGFSAQSIFSSAYIATFNAIWASVPTLIYGITEQDVSPRTAMAYPQLYAESRTQGRKEFWRAWILWQALGFWHGVCAFFIPLYALKAVDPSGNASTLVQVGTGVMTAVVVTVTLRVAVRTHYWTWLNHSACWGTLILWLPFLCILGVLWPAVWGMGELFDLAGQLLSRAQFWFACIVCAPGAAILLDCVVMALQRHLRPRLSQLLQEHEQQEAKAHKPQPGGPPTDLELAAWEAHQQHNGSSTKATAVLTGALNGSSSQGLAQELGGPSSSGGSAFAPVPLLGGRAKKGKRRGWGQRAAPRSDQYDVWGMGGVGGEAYAGLGGGQQPRTLGGMASLEWNTNYLSASPQVLARTHTKRQIRSRSYRAPISGLELATAAAAEPTTPDSQGSEGAFAADASVLQPLQGAGFRGPAGPGAGGNAGGMQRQQQQSQQQQQRLSRLAGPRSPRPDAALL